LDLHHAGKQAKKKKAPSEDGAFEGSCRAESRSKTEIRHYGQGPWPVANHTDRKAKIAGTSQVPP
jgi:hypothetical protein